MGTYIKENDSVVNLTPIIEGFRYCKSGLSEQNEAMLIESNSRGSACIQIPGVGAADWPMKNIAPDVVIAVPYTSSKLSAEIAVGDIEVGGFNVYLKNTGGYAAYFKVMWLALWK